MVQFDAIFNLKSHIFYSIAVSHLMFTKFYVCEKLTIIIVFDWKWLIFILRFFVKIREIKFRQIFTKLCEMRNNLV